MRSLYTVYFTDYSKRFTLLLISGGVEGGTSQTCSGGPGPPSDGPPSLLMERFDGERQSWLSLDAVDPLPEAEVHALK